MPPISVPRFLIPRWIKNPNSLLDARDTAPLKGQYLTTLDFKGYHTNSPFRKLLITTSMKAVEKRSAWCVVVMDRFCVDCTPEETFLSQYAPYSY